MPLVQAAEVYRLLQSGNFGGDILIQNVWHFGRESPGGTPSELANDWNTYMVPLIAAELNPVVTLTEISVQRIAPDESEIERIAGSRAGVAGGNVALPSVAAGVVTWRTQLAGRSRRGRTFWAGLPFDYVSLSDGSSWLAAGQARLNRLGNGIRNRYSLGGNPGAYYLGVWSPKLGGKLPPRDPAKGLTMVVSHTAQYYICSMGSRRLGHGL